MNSDVFRWFESGITLHEWSKLLKMWFNCRTQPTTTVPATTEASTVEQSTTTATTLPTTATEQTTLTTTTESATTEVILAPSAGASDGDSEGLSGTEICKIVKYNT